MSLPRILGGSTAAARGAVRDATGLSPATARWRIDHWLVTVTDSGTDRRWVVLPDGRLGEIRGPTDKDEDDALERLFGNPDRVQVTIRPAAIVVAICFAAALALIHAIWLDPAPATWRDPGIRELWRLVLGSLLAADWASAWLWGLAVTLVAAMGVAVHEFGHGLAARTVGDRWVSFGLNARAAAVRCFPAPAGWKRVRRSAAGPLAQLAFSVPLLATVLLERSGDVWRQPNPDLQFTVLWVPGLAGVILAVANLIPLPGTDGARIVMGVRSVVADRRTRVS